MKSANHKKLRRAAVILASAFFLANSTAQVIFRPSSPSDAPVAPAPLGPLLTRKFEIDAAKFKDRSTNTDGTIPAQQQMRSFLATEGVSFPKQITDSDLVTWTNPGKTFFYNDRLAALWVRASKDDLQKIESALRPFLATPPRTLASSFTPQVNLTARVVEYSDRDSKMFGLDNSIFDNASAHQITWRSFTNFSFTSVLTEPQFRVFINAIENREGLDLLTAPQVTTISGRQARLSVEEPKNNLSPQSPPTLPRDTSPDADPTPANLFKDRTLKIPGL